MRSDSDNGRGEDNDMTPALTYLAWSAALTAVLWIPYILGRFSVLGMPGPEIYRDPRTPDLPAWVERCNRVHLNAVESLIPFAALVLVAHVSGVTGEAVGFWAGIYFWARLAHAIVYWAGLPYIRTLAFAVGLIATLAIFFIVAF